MCNKLLLTFFLLFCFKLHVHIGSRAVQERRKYQRVRCLSPDGDEHNFLAVRQLSSPLRRRRRRKRRHETHTHNRCVLVQVYGYAATLFDALDALLLGGRLLVRTVQCESHGGKTLRFTKRTGLEGALLPPDVPGDVEGVALSVTEAVDDGAADAALLVDGLFERLCFAPVSFQILALRHM